MPRLFVALVLPDEAREKLAGLAGGLSGADWIESADYHLTLRFIGEVDIPAFLDLRDGLGAVSARSFHLDLRGLGVFPLRGDPETLWVGTGRNDSLLSLRNKVESLVVRRGLPPENRKFHPHVTVARLRASLPEWVGAYIAANSLFAVPGIAVQSFALYSSKLAPHGPEYTLEREYPLEGLLEPRD